MAPEQLRSEPVTAQTDTFAAAIVFWELLTGHRLFLAHTDAETVHRILVSRIRPPSAFVPDLPPQIDRILAQGLARDPKDRYPTARAMAQELEACVPAIRLSQVGEWVARMAGDKLAARALRLAAIERAEPHEEAMATNPQIKASPPIVEERVPSVSATAASKVVSTQTPLQAQLRVHGTRLRILWSAAVGLAIGCVAVVTAMHISRPSASDPRSPTAVAQSVPPVSADTAAVPSVPPSPSSTPLPDPPVVSIESLPVAPLHNAAARPPRSSVDSRVRVSHPAPPNDCKPPWVIDSLGRQIFKPQCL